MALRRAVLDRGPVTPGRELVLRVHPEVGQALQQEEREILEELREHLGTGVVVQSDPDLHQERFEISEA